MRKLLAAIGLAVCLSASAQQTTDTNVISGPILEAWQFLTTPATNWIIVPYGMIWDKGSGQKNSYGGGIAAAYLLNAFVAPTIRLDYLDGRFWMPSGEVQLQVPVTILGKFEVIPFGFTGIGTPISGSDKNGQVTGIFGIGGAVKITKHFDLIADYEKWTGFSGNQYRFGVGYKF